MGVLADSLRPDGPAAAAVLAAAVGTFATGVLTALTPASECLRNFLNWYKPAGPLSGKTAGGVLVWLAVWLILHFEWRNKHINLRPVYVASLALIGLAWLLTFPPVVELFRAE